MGMNRKARQAVREAMVEKHQESLLRERLLRWAFSPEGQSLLSLEGAAV
jgi:hypothetical protein